MQKGRQGDFSILSRLLYEWLERQRSDLIEKLMVLLLRSEFTPGQVFDGVLAAAMRRIGVGYESRQITIGDEHRMTQSARDALIGVKRMLSDGTPEASDLRTAIVGCARSEVHEMGALVIRLILTYHGWHVLYLGPDVPTEEFHSQQEKHSADLVCVSMSPMKGVATALEIAQLLCLLGSDKHPFRLAIGGDALEEQVLSIAEGPVMEARLFRSAMAFEDWIRAAASGEDRYSGTLMTKVAPPPGVVSTLSVPPCPCTMMS